MNWILSDFRYAIRLLLKSPFFSVLTVAVLIGGIAISVFTFSFLYTAMFKPVPIEESDSIVKVYAKVDGQRRLLDAFTWAQLRQRSALFEETVTLVSEEVALRNGEITRPYLGVRSEWSVFSFARSEALVGRSLRPEDGEAGAEPVLVLSHRVWQNQFNGDSGVMDQVVDLNGVQTRIVGVMPPAFGFPVATDLWLPLDSSVLDPSGFGSANVTAIARLDDGISLEEVETTLSQFGQSLRQQRVDLDDAGREARYSIMTQTLQEAQVPDAVPLFVSLMALAGFITLLASINVGNLLLARAAARRKETAIRVALGAPGKRLIFQMMLESIVIVAVGGLLAILLAGWALETINVYAQSTLGGSLAFWWEWGLDVQSCGVALVVIGLTLLVAGWLPAWRTSKTDFNAVLRDGTRGSQGRSAGRLGRFLVATQVVLIAVVLFIGSVLGFASFSVTKTDFGFDTQNVLAVPVSLNRERYTDSDQWQRTFASIRSALESDPRVEQAVVMADPSGGRVPVAIDGQEYGRDSDYPQAYVRSVSTNLDALGISLHSGRLLDDRDLPSGNPTALVSAAFADRHWPGGSAIGQRVRAVEDGATWATVVGVVSNTLNGNPMSAERSPMTVYRPVTQEAAPVANVLVRYRGTEAGARDAVYLALRSVDSDIDPGQMLNFDKLLRQSAELANSAMSLLLVCGLFAMILAITGIYGLTANSVIRQTQEIGLRRALGASDGRVLRLLVGQGAKTLIVGLVVAAALCVLVAMLASRLLIVGVLTYVFTGAVVFVVISAVVLAAVYLPARRAVRLEPASALRFE